MSREGAYMVFCLERYRHARHMSGSAAARFFADYGLYAYVMKFFGAFHTMAEELVFSEIDRHVRGMCEADPLISKPTITH